MANTYKRYLYILLFLFLIVRLVGLGTDISNSDAARWHRRSEQFLTALKTLNFEQTYQHYQPGVSLMWINAIIKQTGFTTQSFYSKYINHVYEIKTLENSDFYPIIHGFSKGVLILLLCSLLYYQANQIQKLTSFKISLMFVFFMAFEPYIIGIDRYFHLTSLETYTAFASMLSLLVFKKDTKKYFKYVYYGAIFFAISILTKISTLILLPLMLLILLQIVLKEKDYTVLIKFLLTCCLTIFILFPALWVHPIQTLQKEIYAIFNAVDGDFRGTKYTGIYSILYYPIIYILRISPITLILFIFSIFNTKKLKESYLIKILFIYISLYLVSFTLSDQKIDRYIVSMLPSIVLICSYSLVSFANKYLKLIIFLCIAFFAYISYIYFPIYSAYYAPLFINDSFILNSKFYDNSGEYFAQSAFYLNAKPRNTIVYVPYNTETFSYYYNGNIVNEGINTFNYLVVSVNNLNRVTHIINDNSCVLDNTFGSKLNAITYIYKCNLP